MIRHAVNCKKCKEDDTIVTLQGVIVDANASPLNALRTRNEELVLRAIVLVMKEMSPEHFKKNGDKNALFAEKCLIVLLE